MSDDEKIILRNGELQAAVAAQGAWLESFSVGDRDVLYPKQSFALEDESVKQRGGCHVCLPNFGPGGDSGLQQHGFGRELPWEVATKTDSSVELVLKGGSEAYAGLESHLQYELGDNALTVRLQTTNSGETPLRMSPGFHPYFRVSDSLNVDNRAVPTGEPYDTEFLATAPTKLHIGDATYSLGAENLPQWVAWTDHLGEYFCIEPTQAGYAFVHPPTDDQLLQPGESRVWSLTLTVR